MHVLHKKYVSLNHAVAWEENKWIIIVMSAESYISSYFYSKKWNLIGLHAVDILFYYHQR